MCENTIVKPTKIVFKGVEEKGRVRKHRGGESDHSTGYVCMGISQ
jgi:hypothetical protein